MKPAQAVALGIGIVVLAWASLFVTVLNQSSKTNQILATDHSLLSQDNSILKAQKKTEADLEAKIADLQNHVDCLFNLATQPGSHIANADTCTLTTNSPVSNITPKVSPSPVITPPSTAQRSNPNNEQTLPAPQSQPNVVQRIDNFLRNLL